MMKGIFVFLFLSLLLYLCLSFSLSHARLELKPGGNRRRRRFSSLARCVSCHTEAIKSEGTFLSTDRRIKWMDGWIKVHLFSIFRANKSGFCLSSRICHHYVLWTNSLGFSSTGLHWEKLHGIFRHKRADMNIMSSISAVKCYYSVLTQGSRKINN